LQVLGGYGRAGGWREDGAGELARGVVAVLPAAVDRGQAGAPAEHVVGVVEATVDGPARGVVDDAEDLARGVVGVDGVCAVAVVLAREPAAAVVRVLDDERSAAVGQAR